MYCRDCGEKLSLRFLENEGLVPYCVKCGKFKFPFFPVAVLMTVLNRQENKILLAKHVGDEEFKLFAGYIKKGESAEKAIPREIKEETGLTAIKWSYVCSRYHEEKDILMLQFIVKADDTAPIRCGEEICEARWCDFEEAKELIKKNSMAQTFMLNVIADLQKKTSD